eukprot:GILI01005510.1.p1 GENE.GILI01005510.1~~GILI01005510.1.p1  ORF type:complete len:200 (+),score=23.27 GILI01005510.1:36-635(+)
MHNVHPFLKWSFRVLNIFVILIALSILGIAGYLIERTQIVSFFNGIILALGFVTLIISALSLFIRKRLVGLNVYLISFLVLLLAEIALVAGLYVDSSSVIQFAKSLSPDPEAVERVVSFTLDNIDMVRAAVLASIGVQLLCLLVGYRARLSWLDAEDFLLPSQQPFLSTTSSSRRRSRGDSMKHRFSEIFKRNDVRVKP